MSALTVVMSIFSASVRTLLEAGCGIVLLCAWRARWKWQVRKLEQQRAQLEATIAARTREYEQKTLQAEEANRMKSQFLANMSHQIRTSMNGTLGILDLALGKDVTPEQQEYLTLSRRSVESILTLLDDISEFSRMGSKSLAIEHEEFSLAYCLKGVQSTIQARFDLKGSLSIRIVKEVPDRVVGDAHRIRQLLLKVLEGTVEAAAERVTIGVELEQPPRFDAERRETVLSLLFSVHNISAGNAPKDAGREFRLDVCRWLAAMMGGRFWVDSGVNPGSRAYFTAVVGVAESQLRSEPANGLVKPVHQTPRSGATVASVLLAECDPGHQLVTQRLVEEHGFQTLLAENGDQVLELVEHAAVDLILMDMQMPGIDGYEVTRRIRERERGTGRHVPIIALTAVGMEGERQKCLMAGTDAYLAKPIRSDQLYQRMDMVLLGHGLVDALSGAATSRAVVR